MTTNFWQVLEEMRDEEKRLETELKTIRDAIPGVEILAKRTPAPSTVQRQLTAKDLPPLITLPYSQMGPSKAILAFLETQSEPRSQGDVAKAILEGGVNTRSTDIPGLVATTLTQLKVDGFVERFEDSGWRIKKSS